MSNVLSINKSSNGSNRKAPRFADLPTVRNKHRKRAFGAKLYPEIVRRFESNESYEYRIKDFADFAKKHKVAVGTVGYYMRAMENERDLEKVSFGVYVLAEDDENDPS